MPVIQKLVERYIGRLPERGVDPMECVAKGAAIQAGVLQGDVKDVLLLDVTPLTLGIETMGGVSTALIERNTTVPTSKSQVFSTASDNQPSVEIHILQGERPMAADNRTLGRFMLDGLPPAQRGVPQVEVTFDIDANGILKVTAKDKGTNKMQHITIKDSSALSKEEIERMKKEAEVHASDDRKRKELIDLRNQADALVHQTEKTIKEAGDKIKAEDKKAAEEKVEALKKAKDGNDQDALKKAYDALGDVIQKIGAEMYKSAPTGQAGDAPKDAGTDDKKDKSEPEVVDGDFSQKK